MNYIYSVGEKITNFLSGTEKVSEANTETASEVITLQSSTITKSVRTRKSDKTLTTCNTCGHYRFAMKIKRGKIVNRDFPYEHSPTGGCPVNKCDHIEPGKRFRKLCICEKCKHAALVFKHTAEKLEKFNQYPPNPDKKHWNDLKKDGWYRYAGCNKRVPHPAVVQVFKSERYALRHQGKSKPLQRLRMTNTVPYYDEF